MESGLPQRGERVHDAPARASRRGVGLLGAAVVLLAAAGATAIAAPVPDRQDRATRGVSGADLGLAGRAGPLAWVPGELIVRLSPSPGLQVVSEQAFASARGMAGAEMERIASRTGAQVLGEAAFRPTASMRQGLFLYRVKVAGGLSLDQAARALEREPGVLYASRNYIAYLDAVRSDRTAGPADAGPGVPPDDPGFAEQWGLHNTGQAFHGGSHAGAAGADIDALGAWDLEIGNRADPVVVAVIDTGVQFDHPDLAANMWTNPGEIPGNGLDDDGNGYVDDVHGWDFYNGDATVYDPGDDNPHGTHVAGTVAAVTNNGLATAGVAWNARIMALKVFGPSGALYVATLYDIVKALAYASDMRTRHNLRMLTSNSWGYGVDIPDSDKALKDAIEASDMLFVAAAGNEAADNDATPHNPASFDLDNIVAVAATDWNDGLSGFSNWGATSVDLAAPGSEILSLYPTDNPMGSAGCDPPAVCSAFMSGTSMAAPHVSGVAALVMSRYPGMSWAQVKKRLLDSVDRKPGLAGRVLSEGRLNARNALGRPVISAFTVTPRFGLAPLSVSASAQATGGDGSVASYAWDFGDGSSAGAPAAGHTYAAPGSYTVTLSVTGDDGMTASERTTVHVLADAGSVVFVDDDDSDPDSESYLAAALTGAGVSYVQVTPSDLVDFDETVAGGLVGFPVVWNAGRIGFTNDAEQAVLRQYLDGGGRLLLAAQDELYNVDVGPGKFATEYLHVEAVQSDVGTETIQGVAGDPITDGIRITLSYPSDPAFDDYSDTIVPRAGGAAGIFTNSSGGFNALRHAGTYRLVFVAFPLEAVPAAGTEPNTAGALMRRIHRFLTAAPPQVALAAKRYGAAGSPVHLTAAVVNHPIEPLTYGWELVSRPTGSTAAMANADRPTATFVPDRMGTYGVRVTVTDGYGLAATAESTVEVVHVYAAPNPAGTPVTFHYDGSLTGGTLRVYSVAGRQVRSLALNAGGSTSWDLADSGGRPVANGIYLWLLFDQEDKPVLSSPERLVIQR